MVRCHRLGQTTPRAPSFKSWPGARRRACQPVSCGLEATCASANKVIIAIAYERSRPRIQGSDVGASYLLRDTLSAFHSRLDPARFARVHRSLVVNLDRVQELEPLCRGEYVIWLRNGTRLVSGRTYRALIQALFHL